MTKSKGYCLKNQTDKLLMIRRKKSILYTVGTEVQYQVKKTEHRIQNGDDE